MIAPLRIACRTLLKSPGFTVIALVTLALGIGVNTSMYTLMDVLLFRAAPFPEPDRLVRLLGNSAQSPRGGFAFHEAIEIRQQIAADPATLTTPGRPFESITVYTFWNNTYAEPGQPAERLAAVDATADLFKTFRVQPILGRAFTAEEEVPGRNQVALLSHALWQSRFGGDPGVIGRSLRLNAEQVTIIGVMPASFTYPMMWGKVDLWRPITTPQHIVENRTNRFFSVVGRLNPDVSYLQAQAQLDPLMTRWLADHPHATAGRSFEVMALHKSTTGDEDSAFVGLLVGLAGFVLLIACANLANLQLARATLSARDFAIRSALGASRSQLIGYQLTESFVLALAGGVGGVIVASWLNGLLGRAIQIGDSGGLPLPMDARILTVTLVVTVLTGVLFGLLPAWLASRPDVVSALKQQSRGSTTSRGTRWLRSSLIVAEVALALALLAGAGVMIRGFQSFLRQDNGWDTNLILAANIHLPEGSTYNTEDKRQTAIDKLTLRLAQVGGVEQTAICSTLPLFGDSATRGLHVDGQTSEDPSQVPLTGVTIVTSNFFATLGIPVLEGTTFRPDLRADHPPVVVVNDSLARKFWPNGSAIGQRVGMREGDEVVWREIVGVVRDIRHPLNPSNPTTRLQVYKPLVHEPWGYLNLLIRAENPARFKNDLRRVVADVDGDVAVQQLLTIPDAVDRFQHNLFVINYTLLGFAVLGLALAALGLYGVISNLVAQRTSEFGIRLALGAKPSDVLRLVMVTGMKLGLLGLAIGLGLAYAVNRFLGSFMPRLAASDPVTLGLVAAILFAVTLFACWWPARRATRVDPLVALRAE
ncbi:MAG TPA: ABC transporter permease [Candidatus Synoicihabitans sp.]|nr:ABC transporter permease [Candidatus Synoicihabitans sp.]